MLCGYPDEDIYIFSSVRPKIGKVFSSDGFEERKKELLKSCRHDIIELGKEEAREILEKAKLDHAHIIEELQSLPPAQYRDLLNFSYRYEKKLLEQFTSKHQRKIEYHWRRKNTSSESLPTLVPSKPEKKKKHRLLLKERRKKRDKKRRSMKRKSRAADIKKIVEEIKNNNLVHNFSSQDIPDEAYLYLSLGSTFAPVKDVKRHDHDYDAKLFGRKLAWAAYHHSKNTSPAVTEEVATPTVVAEATTNRWSYPEDLKPTGTSWPPEADKRLDSLLQHLNQTIERTQRERGRLT